MSHLEKMTVKNFLCYQGEHSFSFSPGVNAIIGPNGKGKSTILSAVSWVVFGKPSGDTVMSWNSERDTFVRLYFADGLCVERSRTRDKNFYFWSIKNEPRHELTAIGNSVPEEIEKLLQLQDINFQGQANNLFPIQMTPSELGIAINRYCQLSDMHETVKRLNTEIAGDEKEYEYSKKQITELDEKIQASVWAVSAEGLSTSASAQYFSFVRKTEQKITVSHLIEEVQKTKKKLKTSQRDIVILKKEIEGARVLKEIILIGKVPIEKGRKLLSDIAFLSSSQTSLRKTLKTEKEVIQARLMYGNNSQKRNQIRNAKKPLEEILELRNRKEEQEKRIIELKDLPIKYRGMLPPICPLCGEERRKTK